MTQHYIIIDKQHDFGCWVSVKKGTYNINEDFELLYIVRNNISSLATYKSDFCVTVYDRIDVFDYYFGWKNHLVIKVVNSRSTRCYIRKTYRDDLTLKFFKDTVLQ